MFNLATLSAEKGDVERAISLMKDVIQLQPKDPDNHKTVGILR
jgi:hypothetical protein